MTIQVSMTYEQYYQANRMLLMHSTLSRKINLIFALYLCPAIGTLLAVLTVWMWIVTSHFPVSFAPCVVFAAICLFAPFSFRRRVKKVFRQQEKHLTGVMILEASGLDYVRSDGTANVHYAWNGFESWLDLPESFLLFPNPCSLVRIPKQDLSPMEQHEVQGWIEAVVKSAK